MWCNTAAHIVLGSVHAPEDSSCVSPDVSLVPPLLLQAVEDLLRLGRSYPERFDQNLDQHPVKWSGFKERKDIK